MIRALERLVFGANAEKKPEKDYSNFGMLVTAPILFVSTQVPAPVLSKALFIGTSTDFPCYPARRHPRFLVQSSRYKDPTSPFVALARGSGPIFSCSILSLFLRLFLLCLISSPPVPHRHSGGTGGVAFVGHEDGWRRRGRTAIRR